MKILSIELVGFKRFLLNDISHFKLDFTQLVQVVIGTNGSGKTSLLDQLFPLPPLASDFDKEGKKVLRLTHDGVIYELTSIFSPSQKHFFIRDGVELNEGGTLTVQRELCKTHFSITPEIKSLLMGYESFSQMAPNRRKDWFVKLCDVDYAYAIRVYMRTKERHRDVVGALKLAKKRLIIESEKQLKDDEQQRLLDEVTMLERHYDELLAVRPVLKNGPSDMLQARLDHNAYITKIIDRLEALERDLSHQSGYTDAGLIKIINGIDTRVSLLQKSLSEHSKSLEADKRKLDILKRAENKNLQEIRVETLRLEREVDVLLASGFDYDPCGNYASMALKAFEGVSATLVELFGEIPDNTDKRFSSEKLQSAQADLQARTLQLQNLQRQIGEIELKLEHMKAHQNQPNIRCVSCKHEFSLHYDAQVEAALLQKHKELIALRDVEVLPQHVTLGEYVEECRNYATKYRQYMTITSAMTVLAPVFAYIGEHCPITSNARALVSHCSTIVAKLERSVAAAAVHVNLVNKRALLETMKNMEQCDLEQLQTAITQRIQAIEDQTAKLMSLTMLRKRFERTLKLLGESNALRLKLKEGLAHEQTLEHQHAEAIRGQLIHQLARNVQANLGSRHHMLQQSRMQAGIISNIELQITDLEAQEEEYRHILTALSPTEGLIAEGLMGFIQEFISKMNHIVSTVWEYPMRVHPCRVQETDSVDLDYKFPMEIRDMSKPIADISMGSKGQVEFCNLAFRIVAMSYLGLTDTPLILDEMGSALDHAHRNNLILLIKSLVEQRTFSQVVLVSHDYTQYTALPEVDLCVLCADNVILPEKTRYNQNAVLN